jgi:branched-chain amino acid aminotransferase
MTEYIAYCRGDFVPDSQCTIPLTDSGFMFGLSVTESTRTFNGAPFKLARHIDRLYLSMKAGRIEPGLDRAELTRLSLEVVERNRDRLGGQDIWLVHDVTGGPMRQSIGAWVYGPATIIIRCYPIDFSWFADYYKTGVHAVTPAIRQIPPQCLDPKLKHRNRFHMSLAEFQVKDVDPDGFSVLLDIDGNLAENKGANFFIVTDGVLRTPTTRAALAGISRETVLELAAQLGIPTREEDLQPYHVTTADEAFFTSTPYCILPAVKFNGTPIGDGQPGPIYRKLLAAWSDLVGLDIAAQARQTVAV